MMQCNTSEVVTRPTRKSALRPPTDNGEMGFFLSVIFLRHPTSAHKNTVCTAYGLGGGVHTRRFVYDQETENRTWKGKKREGEKDRFGKRYMVAPTLSVCVCVRACSRNVYQ